MPTFPRLGKHSDRSHNNLTEDSSSSPPPGQGLSSTLSQFRLPSRNSSETSFNDQRTQPPTSAAATYHQQQHPAPSAGDGASIGGGGGGGARIASQQQLYNNNSSSDVGDSQSFFAGRRHSEFDTVDPSVQRSQSQSQTKSHRYSAYAGIPSPQPQPHLQQQQQQQQQGTHADSVGEEDQLQAVPVAAAPPSSEKKSKRSFIKGIFSGSSRLGSDSQHHHQQQQQQQHQQHQQQSSYDNTGNLSRRLSKRDPASSSSQRLQTPNQLVGDWQSQGGYSLESSPLRDVDEIEEYQSHPRPSIDERRSDRDFAVGGVGGVGILPHSQQAQPQLTARSVTAEDAESSSYQQQGGAYHPLPVPAGGSGVAPAAAGAPPLTHLQQQQQGLNVLAAAPSQPHLQQQQQQQQQQQAQSTQPTQPTAPLSSQPQQPHVQLQQQHHSLHQQQLDPSAQQQQQQQLQPQGYNLPPQYTYTQQNTNLSQAQLDQLQRQQQHQQNHDTPLTVSRDSLLTDPDQLSTSQHSSLQNQQQQQAHDSSPNPQAQPVMAPSTQGLTRGGKGSLRDQPGGSGAGAQTPRFEQSSSLDLGRQSPQPDRDSTEGEKAFNELLAKYKNVKRLYFDRKAVIEGLNGQVEQLQNAVANQRITHSRTALDDNEYSARSNRLNGAIMNLAFNIRKDWKSLPPWLASKVSADALKTGKQEMTAVGRATISRWLTEELFDKCFHPGLDEELSSQLKMIELSIRGNAYTMHSQEEFDALTTKVVHWRMATLDGLQSKLSPDLVDANKQALMKRTTINLTNYLYKFLNDPPPAGVDGSTSMIAELAVSIAGNLPLESRDVAINYPLPGDIVRPDIMEVEKTELPPIDDGDSDEDSDEDSDGKAAAPKELKVRFAAFMAWEVRGRQVLVKAPVWTM